MTREWKRRFVGRGNVSTEKRCVTSISDKTPLISTLNSLQRRMSKLLCGHSQWATGISSLCQWMRMCSCTSQLSLDKSSCLLQSIWRMAPLSPTTNFFFLKHNLNQLRQRSFVNVREKSTMVWWVVHSTRIKQKDFSREDMFLIAFPTDSVKRKWMSFTHWLVEGLNDHQRPVMRLLFGPVDLQSSLKILQRQQVICQKTRSTIFELTANTTLNDNSSSLIDINSLSSARTNSSLVFISGNNSQYLSNAPVPISV